MASPRLLVIFGAGASFDSVLNPPRWADDDWRPPLALQLFENRNAFGEVMERFRQSRAIIGELRSAVANGEPVEERMQTIADRAEDYPRLQQALLALQFYLQEVTWRAGVIWATGAHGLTNYLTLAAFLEEWRFRNNGKVRYVTFNYDLMLEAALDEFLRLRTPEAYIASDETMVFKLHGSANWGRELANETSSYSGDQRGPMLKEFDQLQPTDTYRVLGTFQEPQYAGNRLLPVIALPMKTKSDFVCPPSHLDALKQELPMVTHLLIVGWRAQEQHFLRLLGEGLAPGLPCHLVAGSAKGAVEIRNALGQAGVSLGTSVYSEGFSRYVTEIHKVAELLSLPPLVVDKPGVSKDE